MINKHRTTSARRALLPLAGVTLVATALGLTGTPASARCTFGGRPPGQMVALVAPFDGEINPGNPYGLEDPVVPTVCRPDQP
jgi:hypothetical protein